MKNVLIDPGSPPDKPETEQMVVIHRALRRECALLPALVATVPDSDPVRARTIGEHLSLVLGLLHDHHEAEDELLWPLLRQRVPLHKKLIDVMEHQHQTVADALTVAGLILEDATPPQRAWFMSMLPLPARGLWRLVGARRYAAYVREIRAVAGH